MQWRGHCRIATQRDAVVEPEAPSHEVHASTIWRVHSNVQLTEEGLWDYPSARFPKHPLPSPFQRLRTPLHSASSGAAGEMIPQWIKLSAAVTPRACARSELQWQSEAAAQRSLEDLGVHTVVE